MNQSGNPSSTGGSALRGGALAALLRNPVHRCRREFSRRRFLRAAAAAPGLVMAAGAWRWAEAKRRSCEPKPLPHVTVLGGGLPDIHVLLPGVLAGIDEDPSTITDFNGHLGYAIVDGTGVRTDKATNQQSTMPFEVDLRFMKGEFVGADGRRCHGAFALI